jgi:hypothetical protein
VKSGSDLEFKLSGPARIPKHRALPVLQKVMDLKGLRIPGVIERIKDWNKALDLKTALSKI